MAASIGTHVSTHVTSHFWGRRSHHIIEHLTSRGFSAASGFPFFRPLQSTRLSCFHSSYWMGKRSRGADGTPLPSKPLPKNLRNVTVDGRAYTAITEGLATVLFPGAIRKIDRYGKEYETPGEVFYNPVQQFNRDLSVIAIKKFGENFLSERRAKLEAGSTKRKRKSRDGETALRDEVSDCQNNASDFILPLEAGIPMSTGLSPSSDSGNRPMLTEIARELKTPRFTILDALSATGLRALRYALEIPFATSVTANDMDRSAVDSIQINVEYNKCKLPEDVVPGYANPLSKIKVSLGNAQHHMYSVLSPPQRQPGAMPENLPMHTGKYEVIDLDPYGTAVPFLDAAVQAITDGGLLCVTCTDSGVWASTGYSEKCFSLYGGVPVKAEWCHEAGLRLILHSVATAAAKYGCSIEPLLSLSIDFYARLFVRVRRSPAEVKKLASTTIIVYNCDEGCGSWTQQTLGKVKENANKSGKGTFLKFGLARAPTTAENCVECGFPMHLAGPMWGGPLHSAPFVNQIISALPDIQDSVYGTIPRMTGMLQTALQETALAEHPFFHIPARLSRTLRCEAPPQAAIRGALMKLGYLVSRSHCKPNSIKTNAPNNILWEIMKRWTKVKPIKSGSIVEGMAGYKIVARQSDTSVEVVFDEELGKEDRTAGVVRYQINPTANWGPMGRARSGGENGKGAANDLEQVKTSPDKISKIT